MSLTQFLKKLLTRVELKNNGIFSCPRTKQEQYLDGLKEPQNNIERSFNQYKCQMFFYNKIFVFLMNVAAFPVFFYFWLKYKDLDRVENKYAESIFFADGKPENIIPECLRDKIGEFTVIEDKGASLSRADKLFIKKIMRKHPFSWYFLLKILIKISNYSYEINTRNPSIIIVCNEYSFTSSVLTEYCHVHGIRHVDVMHGEKVFDIHDSFFRYDECYIWDDYYKNLFVEMRAYEDQFIVAIPPSLDFCNKYEVNKIFDYTYYLGAETGEVLKNICNMLNVLVENGMKVALRPHPRYTNMDELIASNSFTIENVREISLEESVLRTKNAISLFSTVLNQAYFNGTHIVIDDISEPQKYNSLESLGYVMLKYEHDSLSRLMYCYR